MKVHVRLVIETDPDFKKMASEIKHITGRFIKEIIENFNPSRISKGGFPSYEVIKR